jgi:hypothetical protein
MIDDRPYAYESQGNAAPNARQKLSTDMYQAVHKFDKPKEGII